MFIFLVFFDKAKIGYFVNNNRVVRKILLGEGEPQADASVGG